MSGDGALNERQKEFARCLALGMNNVDAYRKAFDCKGKAESTVRSAACRLAKKRNVLDFVAQLDAPKDEAAKLGKAERLGLLAAMASDARAAGDIRAAVACIAEMNKMDGAYVAEAAAAAKDEAFRAAILRGTDEPLVRLNGCR